MKATAKRSAKQAYVRGDKVAILNRTYSGKLIFEGWARVVDQDSESYGQYWVHFITKDGKLDAHGAVERWIEDAAQADPEKYVKNHQ